MYILDTNTLIYYFKGQGQVAQNFANVSPEEIGISTIVLFELQVGIAKSIAVLTKMEYAKTQFCQAFQV